MLAGFFGGPLAAIVTAVIGAAARASVGGPAVIGGMVSFGIYAVVGAVAGRIIFGKLRRNPSAVDFVLIAAVSIVAVVPAFFIDRGVAVGLLILEKAWFILILGNLFGVVTLGLVFEEVGDTESDLCPPTGM